MFFQVTCTMCRCIECTRVAQRVVADAMKAGVPEVGPLKLIDTGWIFHDTVQIDGMGKLLYLTGILVAGDGNKGGLPACHDFAHQVRGLPVHSGGYFQVG